MPAPIEATNASLEGVSCTAANECGMVGSSVAGAPRQVLAEKEVPGNGPHQITVEAVDAQGNTQSETIEISVPDAFAGTPDCNTEPTSAPPREVVSQNQAVAAIEEALPAAVAPSIPTTVEATDEQIDPSYSSPNPNLESVGNRAEAETSVTPAGGFTLAGIACVTPAETTAAATQAKVVNGDVALFANTAPETDTLIRPSAGA
jgi:hypothetical protein